MANEAADNNGASKQRLMALSRWDNEGGAGPNSPHPQDAQPIPELTNAELVQLRMRVIALENLMIAYLAQASDQQLALAREMASFIEPRAGSVQHPLTIQAATHMIHLVERADHFR